MFDAMTTSAEIRYPYGYGRGTYTMEELKQRYAPRMHPEAARRMFAWIESRGGHIGIGGGWRVTPSNVSSASRAGKSFHQDQTFKSGMVGYCAWDLVARNGNDVHRSPTWSEVPKQDSGHADIERFGVHCNVSNEPWHMQPFEIDGWQSWSFGGREDPTAGYPIDGNAPDVPDPGWPPFVPEDSEYSLYPLAVKPEVHAGYKPTPADLVRYLQAVMTNQCTVNAGGIDGYPGPKTIAAVKQLQGWNGLVADGRCGPKTWRAVDIYATS